jgi:hypothetical protein
MLGTLFEPPHHREADVAPHAERRRRSVADHARVLRDMSSTLESAVRERDRLAVGLALGNIKRAAEDAYSAALAQDGTEATGGHAR